MSPAPPDHIWYASYGSNLNRARFLTYIEGGTPVGSQVLHKGCTDKTPPIADTAMELPQSLYFAGWSDRAWGGTAAAFITLEPGRKPTLGRAYLVARNQFEQVVQQENANIFAAKDLVLDIGTARSVGHSAMTAKGYYSELIYCGTKDGFPILSFTASVNRTDFNTPSRAYLQMIHSGLQESHGLSSGEIVEYFRERPGISGTFSDDQLLAIFADQDPRHPTG